MIRSASIGDTVSTSLEDLNDFIVEFLGCGKSLALVLKIEALDDACNENPPETNGTEFRV
jgi:hypothetical protein